MKQKNKVLNAVFISIGATMALIIAVMLIYMYFRDEHKSNYRITKQEFAALADEDLTESAFLWTEKFCPITTSIKIFNSAPKPCRNVHAMYHLEAQVLNGGFCQFYYNGYHKYGFDYIGAFRDAGIDNIADLLNGANECFESIKYTMPSNGDTEAFSRWCTDNPLLEFDDVYSGYYDVIYEKIIQYIRQNIKCFGD